MFEFRHAVTLSLFLAGNVMFAGEVVFADFEGESYAPWEAAGEAFGSTPARGTLPSQQKVEGYLGKGLVNSYLKGDTSTGELRSPEFVIQHDFVNFLIGGGEHPGKTCLNLEVQGEVVRTATGLDAERLQWHTWNVKERKGSKARLVVVDGESGGWGHVNLDHIVFSDTAKTRPGPPDPIVRAMASVEESAQAAAKDSSRPAFHFRPPGNWMNDPNGPIFHGGYLHMFYQHNPYGENWGHMHWGHARTKDLIRWQHMPIALAPSKELGEEHVFSGSATLDGEGRPILFYTSIAKGKSAGEHAEQWAALGDEKLVSWRKLPANPIMEDGIHGGQRIWDWRDPYHFKYQGQSYMVLGGNLNQAKGGQAVVTLYKALNSELTRWEYRGILFTHPDREVVNIECPNFFELDGKWVLIISPHRRVEYFVGSFDGKTFTPSTRGMVDHSDNYYAPNGTFDSKGNHLLWGWVRGFPGGGGWNGCLTLPRRLSIDRQGLLRQTLAPEVKQLREDRFHIGKVLLKEGMRYAPPPRGNQLEIQTEVQIQPGARLAVILGGGPDRKPLELSYEGGRLKVGGQSADLQLGRSGILKLRVLVDRSLVEVFANDSAPFSVVHPLQDESTGVEFKAEQGTVLVRKTSIWRLRSAW